METIQPGYGEQARAMFANRDGIEVVRLDASGAAHITET